MILRISEQNCCSTIELLRRLHRRFFVGRFFFLFRLFVFLNFF